MGRLCAVGEARLRPCALALWVVVVSAVDERCETDSTKGTRRRKTSLMQRSFNFQEQSSVNVLHWNFTNASASVIAEFEAWDQMEGPSSARSRKIIMSDREAWPAISGTDGGWKWPGIDNARVMVLSMPDDFLRRSQFRDSYASLSLAAGAMWFPAAVGTLVPDHLRWLRGYLESTTSVDDKPEQFGRFISHLGVLRQSQQECPNCDLVVFEDDIVFAPNFVKHFADFVESVPSDWDVLRIGAHSLSTPPFAYTPKFIHVEGYSNAWGHVVRAIRVKEWADILAALPGKGIRGVEDAFHLFASELRMYAPNVPLIYKRHMCRGADTNAENSNGCETKSLSTLFIGSTWPQGYHRAFCECPGRATLEAINHNVCKGNEANEGCCPYLDPPPVAPLRANLTKWDQLGTVITSAARIGLSPAYYAVHIPKIAGTSFAHDAREILPEGVGFTSAEKCWAAMDKMRELPQDQVVTFFREPRGHVLSQFTMCGNSTWGHSVVPAANSSLLLNISSWLLHFYNGGEMDNIGCYDPVNMQTRAMSCNSLNDEAPHFAQGHPKNMPGPEELGNAPLEIALAHMEAAFFVGITEHYQESMCVFHAKANPAADLPAHCNCKDEDAWSSARHHKVDFHVRKHSVSDLSEAELQLVDALVQDDFKLYEAAFERFKRDVKMVEEARKVKILC
eukprot:TRINITY_DN45292_c0_g1_i1.p1 TRINITY_DN45292_c0_g1~~TRINITY_DN45292_c0_g1_i1.p1  ORF type:complete len:678 (+),score=89.24 TRINITY_DN45292_c0_g1_i1:67-2100(+)